jgi:hypothetical protein
MASDAPAEQPIAPVEAPAAEPAQPWAQEANWSSGIYFSKADDRLIVPKQNKWLGWTLNFGHPWASAVLVGLIVLPIAIVSAKHCKGCPHRAVKK